MSDSEQLEFAVSQQKTLLTHNRADFETLAKKYFDEEKSHGGIIIAVRRPTNLLVGRLPAILNNVTADEMANHVRYI